MRLGSFKKINKLNRGFTFLELLIVISIVAIISASGAAFYVSYSKTVEINSMASTIVSDLKQSQAKAMSGVGGFKWGIHFVNNTNDYYEVFSTATDYSGASKVSTVYLPVSITFTEPASNSNKNIIFNKISGSTSDSNIIISSSGVSKTITISSVGNISVN